jgi:hypothetical protein
MSKDSEALTPALTIDAATGSLYVASHHRTSQGFHMHAAIFVRFAMLSLFASALQAAEPTPKAGEYVADGGWGSLEISNPKGKDGMPFSLETMGANGHLCEMEGRIVGGKAELEASDDPAGCVVRFKPTAEGIAVSGTESCREYCGARAGYEGLYLRPPAGCDGRAIGTTTGEFKRLYDGKRYAQALAKLSPLPKQCGRVLNEQRKSEMLNDIAITQYKLGQRDACVRTLAPLQEYAAMSDDQVRDEFPPADADNWLPIIKAARFNLGLCRKKTR